MAVHVYRPVAEREKLLEGLERTLMETGQGIGGKTERMATRGTMLSIGSYHLARPVVAFTGEHWRGWR